MNFFRWTSFYPTTVTPPTPTLVPCDEENPELELPEVSMNHALYKIEEYVTSKPPEDIIDKPEEVVIPVDPPELAEIITVTVPIYRTPMLKPTVLPAMNFHSEEAEMDWNINEKELSAIQDDEIGDIVANAILSLFG